MFPEFKESAEWCRVGFMILETELGKQVYPDGVNAEQAIDYPQFVLDFYSQVLILARKNGVYVPSRMIQHIEKSLEFICALADSIGKVPMIGDADDARGISTYYWRRFRNKRLDLCW